VSGSLAVAPCRPLSPDLLSLSLRERERVRVGATALTSNSQMRGKHPHPALSRGERVLILMP